MVVMSCMRYDARYIHVYILCLINNQMNKFNEHETINGVMVSVPSFNTHRTKFNTVVFDSSYTLRLVEEDITLAKLCIISWILKSSASVLDYTLLGLRFNFGRHCCRRTRTYLKQGDRSHTVV
jgi:hypothetical protein